ncbi:unnamed protein product [Diabrotica balteata]|uniref:Band 7 domain-containing protein n=1 Tax=Diabrotica balteata TaxID=107213 RepID=A0A9N9TBC0_DIABA|nr:unnamed protein product [Diabrotica balteata]
MKDDDSEILRLSDADDANSIADLNDVSSKFGDDIQDIEETIFDGLIQEQKSTEIGELENLEYPNEVTTEKPMSEDMKTKENSNQTTEKQTTAKERLLEFCKEFKLTNKKDVLTKDSVTVSVDAVVYYRVSNATVSIANVENAHHSTRLLAQTTLRNIMGQRPLHEILSERESISQHMKALLDEATDSWGINVERVEIKDVRLPIQLQRAMAAEAEAAREARAKVIAAEGEQKASRALREASEVIGDSPAALQLRYLQC